MLVIEHVYYNTFDSKCVADLDQLKLVKLGYNGLVLGLSLLSKVAYKYISHFISGQKGSKNKIHTTFYDR